VPKGAGFLRGAGAPETLPPWISEGDIDFYEGEFKRIGFRGGLNYYRNIDRNWEILGAMAGLQVTVPALYMAGDRDLVVSFPGTDQLLAKLKNLVPGLRGIHMLPGRGHWTQQERPNEVNAALVEFLRTLPSRG
jgi:pimeloyl-ACP methyl ester carboxylesterase